jgi:hypothetical protein
MNRHYTFILNAALIIGALLIGPSPLLAQTSSLQGVVTDAQGAVIPGAVVTITSTTTSATRKELSDDMGAYNFLQLPPSDYKVKAEKTGFKVKATTLTLQVDVPATLNLELEVRLQKPSASLRRRRRSTRRTRQWATRSRRHRFSNCPCRPVTWWRC